uniref:Protein kinase domain-containing protein n=1 Tax=Scophthalmus maximus TaxID=52904 RepID=A0A8D3DLG2_SCOMX
QHTPALLELHPKPKMSACSDFAEHVWKPGSCKNCFHPLSAHKTGLGGSVPGVCLKSSLGGDEEAGVTTPSPYSKPTIAVKPTMMSLDTNESTDVNMNIEQVHFLNFSSINGCNKAHRDAVQSPEIQDGLQQLLFFCPLVPQYPAQRLHDVGNIFVTQEEGRGSQSLKNHANGDNRRQQSSTTAIRTKSTYNGSSLTHQASVEMRSSVDIVPSSLPKVHSNGTSSGSTATVTTKTSSTCTTFPKMTFSVDTTRHSPPPALHSVPILSKQTSLSDSSCSYRSSTDSLPGAEGSGGRQVRSRSPESPPAVGNSEPIYAESTKKKRRPQGNRVQSQIQSKNMSCSEPELSGESQWATITVMAAHTEENNRTFYLSSPDSAVSTQCHFSPTARKEPSSPTFRWPSPSHSAPSLATEASLTPTLHPKPQSSPPIPPKRTNRSPKLGTSSLSSSMSSPVPLPDLPKLGTSNQLMSFLFPLCLDCRDATRRSCSSPFARSPAASAPGSPHPPCPNSSSSLPPPLPEKKMVNRTVSAPDSTNGKPFVRAYPRLPFTGSESNVCRPADVGSRSSLSPSPVDPRPIFSSNESLERCHAPLGRPSRSRTLDEPLKVQGRLGVNCRSSITCSSSPQLSAPFSASEQGPAPNLGSSLQLQTLLSNMDSREGVYSKLGGLYAESLRRLALKCEDHFTRSQKNPLRFEESNWSLFRLTSSKPSCNAGDAVYYSAACASDPSHSYAVKICKSPSAEAKQGHLYGLSVQQTMPTHFNLQQDCGHFIACVPQSMLPSEEVSPRTRPAPPLPQPSAPAPGQKVDRERVVVITPEIPQQTAAEFAREWEAFHKSQPEVYERRVCFLLLQLCSGLEHLKEHGVTHRDLCLENLLLVPHHRSGADNQRHLPRLLISNFAKAKRRSPEDAASTSVDPRTKRDHARLAPEIVSAAQYRKFDEFQTGILIYELLHQPNPFEVSPALKEQDYRCEELPPIPTVSLYSAGLQRLAQLLLQPDPIKRIHIQEAKRILQSLLWGPRKDLMEQQLERHGQGGGFVDGSRHEGLLNWLDVKRALLMMKFAERSLEPERNAELEDWLCCQYFSSAHPLSLCHTCVLPQASLDSTAK